MALSPESVTRVPGALRSLVPRVAIPPATRREFTAAAPVIAAVWMLSGLSGGIAPSLVRSVFQLNSGLLNGLSGFIAPATSAVIGVMFARLDPRRSMTIGIYASIVGAIGIIGGVFAGSLAIMIIGQAVAGVGFGASFTASLRLIFPLAAAHQRAGVVAGIYLVSYLAFGVPVVIAGQLAEPLRPGADGLLVQHGDRALGARQPPSAAETGASNVFCGAHSRWSSMTAPVETDGAAWLVALDIDGTVLHGDGSISDAMIGQVRRLDAAGHQVMLATGRSSAVTRPWATRPPR